MLDPSTLADRILQLTNKTRPDFRGWPSDAPSVAEGWAAAVRAYFEGATLPSLVALIPGAHDAAEAAMRARLAADLTLGGPTALANGIVAYAAALAPLVLPTAGVGAPPPVPLVLPALPPVRDPSIPAAAVSAAVHSWAVTGTVTPIGGAPLPWS